MEPQMMDILKTALNFDILYQQLLVEIERKGDPLIASSTRGQLAYNMHLAVRKVIWMIVADEHTAEQIAQSREYAMMELRYLRALRAAQNT